MNAQAKNIEANARMCIMYANMIEYLQKKVDEANLNEWSKHDIQERLLALLHYQHQWDMALVNLTYEENTPEKYSEYFMAKNAPVEGICMGLKAKLKAAIERLEAIEATPKNRNAVGTQREKPDHNRFSGHYCDWPEFRVHMMDNIVSNDELEDDQKLARLKEALSEEALWSVEDITRFSQAWQTIMNRYDKPNNQMLETVQKLIQMPKIQYESNPSIEDAITKYEAILDSLALLNTDATIMITAIIITQMQASILIAWHQFLNENLASSLLQYEEGDYFPSWTEMKAFLNMRMRLNKERQAELDKRDSQPGPSNATLSNISIEQSSNASIEQSSNQQSKKIKLLPKNTLKTNKHNKACFYCPQIHRLYRCVDFKSLSLRKKKHFVKQKNLCARCLDTNHLGNCQAKQQNMACPYCHPLLQYHNSVLCPKRHTDKEQLTEDEEA